MYIDDNEIVYQQSWKKLQRTINTITTKLPTGDGFIFYPS